MNYESPMFNFDYDHLTMLEGSSTSDGIATDSSAVGTPIGYYSEPESPFVNQTSFPVNPLFTTSLSKDQQLALAGSFHGVSVPNHFNGVDPFMVKPAEDAENIANATALTPASVTSIPSRLLGRRLTMSGLPLPLPVSSLPLALPDSSSQSRATAQPSTLHPFGSINYPTLPPSGQSSPTFAADAFKAPQPEQLLAAGRARSKTTSHLDSSLAGRHRTAPYPPQAPINGPRRASLANTALPTPASSSAPKKPSEKAALRARARSNSSRGTGENGKLYSCDFCSHPFIRKHDYERHMRIHTKEAPYKCTQCSACFRRFDALRRHKKSHGEGEATTAAAADKKSNSLDSV
jgi:uncharacterized Zn-finger protein